MNRLESILRRIDRKSYPLYKQIRGSYLHRDFELEVVHVQGDPFAAPSRVAFHLDVAALGISPDDIANYSRRVGIEDAILRNVVAVVRGMGNRSSGSGKSGRWGVLTPGQEIIARTAVELTVDRLSVRLTVGLPAAGRSILGRDALDILDQDASEIVQRGIVDGDRTLWQAHADANEDQDYLRRQLSERGWVAFIAEGSRLPRASGADDRPMPSGAVPWQGPAELSQTITLPNIGSVTGTAVPEGVTLICGGGYHGKSTLLTAFERGVYNHIPGDGRENCVADYDSVAVRAEDGRSICRVNISGFISNLPNQKDTVSFETENASGSTSQAANIIEALEMGARALLIDEDTSATNFMVRDRRMQELVATEKEPITPFVDRIRDLYRKHQVSTVLVVGGAGDYFDVADNVILMDSYIPSLVTDQIKSICEKFPSSRVKENRSPLELTHGRVPLQRGFDTRSGKRPEKIKSNQTRTITIGEHEIDVSFLSQLVDEGQTRTIGDWILNCARGMADDSRTLRDICETLENQVREEGLFASVPTDGGDRVMARRYELSAAINRLRTLEIKDQT